VATILTQLYELADATTPGPKWQKLFPVGKRYRADFPKGIEFNSDTLKSMVTAWESEGKPQRAVNFFHRGATAVPGTVDEKIAAGWIQDLQLRDDGLYALISWTERARGYIVKDELRYLSPEFALAGMDKLTGKPHGPKLLGAGLLNDPFLSDLPRVAATEEPVVGLPRPVAHTEKHMMDCPECGKSIAASPDEKKMADELAAATVKLTESGTKLSELEAATVKLTADLTAAQAESAALKSAALKAEVNAFVEKLVLAGRVAPAIRDQVTKLGETSGLEAIKFFELAPQVIEPKKEIGVSGVIDPAQAGKIAERKLAARDAELAAKGIKLSERLNLIRSEMPEDYAAVYSKVS
jgi:phage I-like protein